MQLNAKQVLASAAAAMLAALIASAFGEQGTIIGVAIGSIVATTATVLIARSVERAHHVVRRVRTEGVDVLRRVGQTAPVGEVTHAEQQSTPAAPTDRGSVVESAPAGSAQPAGTEVVGTVEEGEVDGPSPPLRWKPIVLAVVAAFAVALVLVTSIELIVGRPISTLFGKNTGKEPSIGEIFNPPSPTTTSSTTTTTTTPASSTTSTTTPTSSTTTQPAGGEGSTTTSSSTTSTTPSSSSTTTSTTATTTTTVR
jgi:hypothetical protein